MHDAQVGVPEGESQRRIVQERVETGEQLEKGVVDVRMKGAGTPIVKPSGHNLPWNRPLTGYRDALSPPTIPVR
jgi:hypothetical protein